MTTGLGDQLIVGSDLTLDGSREGRALSLALHNYVVRLERMALARSTPLTRNTANITSTRERGGSRCFTIDAATNLSTEATNANPGQNLCFITDLATLDLWLVHDRQDAAATFTATKILDIVA